MAADVVLVSYLKWPDHPHWQFAARRLGEDEHGVWVGAGPGAQMSRPDEVVPLGHAWVLLLPHAGSYTAIFNARPGHCAVYVDIATQPVWATDAVRSIDLDAVTRLPSTTASRRPGLPRVSYLDGWGTTQVTLGLRPV